MFDFNGAYLNGELGEEEVIYMKEPEGYEQEGGGAVKQLKKSLYGLKQAGRKWYDVLAHTLTDLGFHISHADPGVFHASIEGHSLILAVHVDNCVLTGSSAQLISKYKQKLHSRHALTDLGPIHWLLGIKVTCDCAMHTISLSQHAYIDIILA